MATNAGALPLWQGRQYMVRNGPEPLPLLGENIPDRDGLVSMELRVHAIPYNQTAQPINHTGTIYPVLTQKFRPIKN